jgi:hypothetical protein
MNDGQFDLNGNPLHIRGTETRRTAKRFAVPLRPLRLRGELHSAHLDIKLTVRLSSLRHCSSLIIILHGSLGVSMIFYSRSICYSFSIFFLFTKSVALNCYYRIA